MLESNLHVCFLGGDRRQMYVAQALSERAKINAVGECFDGCVTVKQYDSPIKALHGAKVIVLPLPASKCNSLIEFESLAEIAKKNGALVLGGMLSTYMRDVMDALSVQYYDYYDDECLTIKNAYLTAEGALNIIMNELECDLKSADFSVFGYGRIGSALAQMLKSLGAHVTVYARRREILALAKERGFDCAFISPNEKISGRIIINTVPSRIISNEQLLELPDGSVLIELASLPGGFDPEIAEQCGHKVIKAGGVPGKYAPRSAGEAVAESLLTILEREELL